MPLKHTEDQSWRTRLQNGFRTSAQNYGRRFGTADLLRGGGPRNHFRVHAEFSNSADNELGVLAAEINDVNGLMGHRPFVV